jgi:hypothetical protein
MLAGYIFSSWKSLEIKFLFNYSIIIFYIYSIVVKFTLRTNKVVFKINLAQSMIIM